MGAILLYRTVKREGAGANGTGRRIMTTQGCKFMNAVVCCQLCQCVFQVAMNLVRDGTYTFNHWNGCKGLVALPDDDSQGVNGRIFPRLSPNMEHRIDGLLPVQFRSGRSIHWSAPLPRSLEINAIAVSSIGAPTRAAC